jgi:hypothetical protein
LPTWAITRRFDKDWKGVSEQDQDLFRAAVAKFVVDSQTGKYRKGLILVVFLAGILRVPTAVLELTGKVSTRAPAWYVGFTAVVGLIQFCIAAAMLLGYRRAGIWGDIRSASD